jgi:hypothetical protein
MSVLSIVFSEGAADFQFTVLQVFAYCLYFKKALEMVSFSS